MAVRVRFTDHKTETAYRRWLTAPPRRGSSLGTAFHRGYTLGTHPPVRTSLAYVAWAAGKEAARLECCL